MDIKLVIICTVLSSVFAAPSPQILDNGTPANFFNFDNIQQQMTQLQNFMGSVMNTFMQMVGSGSPQGQPTSNGTSSVNTTQTGPGFPFNFQLPSLPPLPSFPQIPPLDSLFPNTTLFLNSSDASSTYDVKVVNGTKYEVNRTSGGGPLGDNGSFYHHFHVINISPEETPQNDKEIFPEAYEDFGVNEKNDHQEVNERSSRQKRWSFGDFIETLLRLKYSAFIKPKNETHSEMEEVDAERIHNINRVKLEESNDIHDLSGDTRVNYAFGYQREEPTEDSDAEVFDWGLVDQDEKRSYYPPKAMPLKERVMERLTLDNDVINANSINRQPVIENSHNIVHHDPRTYGYEFGEPTSFEFAPRMNERFQRRNFQNEDVEVL